MDSISEFTIREIETKQFTPYKDTLHLGFQKGDVWLKIEVSDTQVSSEKKINEDRILILSPFIVEKIILFEKQDSAWLIQSGGSLSPTKTTNRLCPYGMHCFTLSSDGKYQQKPFFVKLQHTGYITVKTEISTLSALSQITSAHTESITFSQSIALSLFCIALGLLIIDRSHFILTYSLLQFSIFIYIIFASGKIFDLLPFLAAENYSLINYEFINLRILLTMLLSYSLMKDYCINKVYKITTLLLLGVGLLNFVLIALDYVRAGIYVYLALIALNLPLQFYGLAKTSDIPVNIARLLKLSYFILTMMVIYGFINIFTKAEELTGRGAEFIFYTNYRLNGLAFGVVVFLILILKYYEKMILNVIRDKDLQIAYATSRINNEKLEERQTLIDILTHELKSPLSTLKFAAYSLKNFSGTDNENALRSKRISSSLQRMDQLISHVANSNKVDRYEIDTKPDVIHAMSLVMQIIEDQIDPDCIIENKFNIEIDSSLNFYSNLHLITLIIENLISNALKYASPHTLIRINICENETHSVFSITNYFLIQARPDPEKLFQRYYRHDSFQPVPGMGIGLTLVKDAAEKSASDINFQLEDDHIIFILSIPICKP